MKIGSSFLALLSLVSIFSFGSGFGYDDAQNSIMRQRLFAEGQRLALEHSEISNPDAVCTRELVRSMIGNSYIYFNSVFRFFRSIQNNTPAIADRLIEQGRQECVQGFNFNRNMGQQDRANERVRSQVRIYVRDR